MAPASASTPVPTSVASPEEGAMVVLEGELVLSSYLLFLVKPKLGRHREQQRRRPSEYDKTLREPVCPEGQTDQGAIPFQSGQALGNRKTLTCWLSPLVDRRQITMQLSWSGLLSYIDAESPTAIIITGLEIKNSIQRQSIGPLELHDFVLGSCW